MLFTLQWFNRRTGTNVRNQARRNAGGRFPDARVFRGWQQRLWSATARTTRTLGSEDAIIGAVEREPWKLPRDIAR